MAKKYVIELSKPEKEGLLEMTRAGKAGARKIKRAHILLLAGEGKKDEDIMATLHTSRSTVIRTRRRFVFGGLKFALEERSRAGRFPKVTAKVEAVLMTLAQSQPPEGQHRWTLQLLTDRLVTLTKLESLSTEAVRLTLKKTTSNRGSGKNGASRRSSALNMYGGWKISWICMRNRSMKPTRWSVLMKSLTKWSGKSSNLCQLNQADPNALIMNTIGKAPVICSSFCNRWPVGATSKSLSGGLNRTLRPA